MKKDAPPVKEKEGAAAATIVVNLPADAKLIVDDRATTSTSAVRTFATPELEQGKEYYYTLTAEIVREGKTLTSSQRVAVRAGETSRITMELTPATGVASK
jgi:uncharacterized protein (TIGR03000 family)